MPYKDKINKELHAYIQKDIAISEEKIRKDEEYAFGIFTICC
ncbi:hypothetical protein OAK46_00675 [OCS116 cluster bacterium]|nr:hypothetical protein [OCS116 cluster bacterium]